VPKVSVLIPVYNGAAEIGRALDSVVAQTYTDYEVVVIDDGSSDNTAEVVGRYPQVRLIRQENQGIGFTRQRLIGEAQGEWVAFIDHDDVWAPDRIERQIPLTTEPEVGLVHAFYALVYPGQPQVDLCWSPPASAHALDHLLPDNRVGTSATLLRRDLLREVGGFPVHSSKAEDWLTWFRMAERCQFRLVPEVLVQKHERPGSASQAGLAWYAAEREVLEQVALPKLDSGFSELPDGQREEFRRMIRKKLGVIASLEGACLDANGERAEARRKHFEAVRLAPNVKGAWFRLGKHLARRA